MFKRIRAVYCGRVQGVGFRFTAERVARNLELCGWVKNLPDGTVEVIAEGQEQGIRQFLDTLQKYFKNYITALDLDWQQASGEFGEFSIIY